MTQFSVSGRLLNVVDPDGQRGLQVSTADLIGPDLTLCHALVHFALSLSVSGLLVPSSAMPQETNVVVFFDDIDDVISEISWTLMTF
jgi:RES domain-containing protein